MKYWGFALYVVAIIALIWVIAFLLEYGLLPWAGAIVLILAMAYVANRKRKR